MSEALSPTLPPNPHACKPTTLAGKRAHDANTADVYVCSCGARWRATHSDIVDRAPSLRPICGCGWERIK